MHNIFYFIYSVWGRKGVRVVVVVVGESSVSRKGPTLFFFRFPRYNPPKPLPLFRGVYAKPLFVSTLFCAGCGARSSHLLHLT